MIQKAQTTDLERITNDIKTQQFSAVPFQLCYGELEAAANTYLDFLKYVNSFPEADRERRFHFNNEDDLNWGYFKRTGDTKNPDRKELFHFTEDLKDRVPELYSATDLRARNFLNSAQTIYDATISTLKDILDEIGTVEPNAQKKFFQPGVPLRGFLRFIKYDELEKGATIGRGHYDKGSITLALGESVPGLRIGPQGAPVEVEHKDRSALFFPGLGFKETFEACPLAGSWHDVIQKADRPYRPGVGRWTIVFFADSLKQRIAGSDETHTYKC